MKRLLLEKKDRAVKLSSQPSCSGCRSRGKNALSLVRSGKK